MFFSFQTLQSVGLLQSFCHCMMEINFYWLPQYKSTKDPNTEKNIVV